MLETEGRFWVRKALNKNDLDILAKSPHINSSTGNRFNRPDLSPEVLRVLKIIDDLAQEILPNAKCVRLISFNKTSQTNWSLPWHQDRVIAVENKFETPGFDNWSQKSGLWHCEPPIEILEKMMFARVHLNDSDETNGCLEVALGSHKSGKVLSRDIANTVAELNIESCIARRGDILFAKALTLHRSGASRSKSPRHALRIDYSNQTLPNPLKWVLN